MSARYESFVSNEPLEIIRINECDARPDLATSRFRRLWNEIVDLREAAQTCSCGHSFDAHSGHTHPANSVEPSHCSQGCGCQRFVPVAYARARLAVEGGR